MLSISLEVAGLLCVVLLQPVFAQYNRATSVEVQNGKPTAGWSEGPKATSTSIEVISPLPTIYYNCYYAGSLCNNVELTQTGAHAGTIDMELVYDKDAKRKKKRRYEICPSKWNKNHVCPEVDQPDVWTIDPSRNPRSSSGETVKTPKKLSTSLQNVAAKAGNKALKYLIADYQNGVTGTLEPSGLMYTCDEFPFASTIQGGTGFKGDSNAGLTYSAATYCAPQSSRCANDLTWQTNWLNENGLLSTWQALPAKTVRSKWLKDQGIAYPSSDQNEQSKALSALAKHFAKLNGDLFLFKLKTINDPDDPRFAYMDTGEEEDENDDVDANTKRDLTMSSKDKEIYTNSKIHHVRDLGIGFSLGLENDGFGIGASIALEHHSRPQTSSSTPTHTPEVSIAFPLQRTSGFISITRSGTVRSIITGSSVEPRPTAENGSYAVPTGLSPSSLGSVTTLPTLSLVSTVLESSSVLSQNGSGTFTDAPKPVTPPASGPLTTIASQSNSSIVSDLTTTLYPATSSHVSSQFINPNSSAFLAINSTWSTISDRSMPVSAVPSVSSGTLPTLNSSGTTIVTTGISNQTTVRTQKPVSGNVTAPSTSSTTVVETSAPFPANQSVGLQESSTLLSTSSDVTSIALPASRSSLSSVVVPTLANATSSKWSTVAILANSTSTAASSPTTMANITLPATNATTGSEISFSSIETSASSNYHYSEHKWWRELNLLKRRSRCLYNFGEPDGSGAHVIYFSSSVLTAPRTQYNHRLVTCSPPCIIVLPPFKLTEETTITPNPTTTKDRTITFPPITTDMVSFWQVTIQNPGDKIIPVPVIDLPKPITLTDEKPPATITPQVTVRLPVLPPIALETPPPPMEPSSTPVPPPPDSNDDDGTEDEEDDEDDDDEEEEGEDDEHCYCSCYNHKRSFKHHSSIFGAQCYFFRAGSAIDDIRPSTTFPFINHRATAATSAINI
ncbi:hypothetical protein KCU99_g5779, partial [Aureobasidium melanogenum]